MRFEREQGRKPIQKLFLCAQQDPTWETHGISSAFLQRGKRGDSYPRNRFGFLFFFPIPHFSLISSPSYLTFFRGLTALLVYRQPLGWTRLRGRAGERAVCVFVSEWVSVCVCVCVCVCSSCSCFVSLFVCCLLLLLFLSFPPPCSVILCLVYHFHKLLRISFDRNYSEMVINLVEVIRNRNYSKSSDIARDCAVWNGSRRISNQCQGSS